MVLELCEVSSRSAGSLSHHTHRSPQELLPNFSSLIMDPFASHPLRALLALLRPNLFPADQRTSTLRSKKSAAYKARQGPMKSVFTAEKNGMHSATSGVPEQFRDVAGRFVRMLRHQLGANEVRALAASTVASPVLQVRARVCDWARQSRMRTENLSTDAPRD